MANGRIGHRANRANFIRWIIRPYDMRAGGGNSWDAIGRMGRMGANSANFIRWIIRPYDMGADGPSGE